jgi:hypothetical protein
MLESCGKDEHDTSVCVHRRLYGSASILQSDMTTDVSLFIVEAIEKGVNDVARFDAGRCLSLKS